MAPAFSRGTQANHSQVKPQLEPTSRGSGRCEFSRFLVAKHEAGTLVRTSVCETSLTWISLQEFVYTGKAMSMNHQHLLSIQIHLKKSMGGDWQRPRLLLYSYIICVCVHSGLSTPEHNIVKSKLCFLCLKKITPYMNVALFCHREFHTCMIDDVFPHFCNQRPNTKHIFQFTEGLVGKLESKTWKNADKNSISVSKTWGKHR